MVGLICARGGRLHGELERDIQRDRDRAPSESREMAQ